MSRHEYRGLLNIASDQVHFGIYAIEKDGYAELMNIHCRSKSELKRVKQNYKKVGFRVYVNG